jgi:hypothetical protein
LPQQISIDGRYLLEDLPAPLIDRDAVAHRGHQLAWDRDLLGAPPTMGDTQVDRAVQLAVGTATAWLSAAHRALHQTAPQEFIERGQLRQQPLAAF